MDIIHGHTAALSMDIHTFFIHGYPWISTPPHDEHKCHAASTFAAQGAITGIAMTLAGAKPSIGSTAAAPSLAWAPFRLKHPITLADLHALDQT